MIEQTITSAFADADLQEFLLNGNSVQTLVYDNGKRSSSSSNFKEIPALTRALQEFALRQGIRVDPIRPFGGSVFHSSNLQLRWHLVIPPMAGSGPIFSVRRLQFAALAYSDFGIDPEHSRKMLDQVKNCDFAVFSGETGSGKTSLMTMLASDFFFEQRVCIIETLAEISQVSPHWFQLLSQKANIQDKGAIDCHTLVEESLRLRPDRYLFGEIRGDEARDVLGLLTAASAGVWTTIHSSEPEQLVRRLAFLSSEPVLRWTETFKGLSVLYFQLQRKQPRLEAVYKWNTGVWNRFY